MKGTKIEITANTGPRFGLILGAGWGRSDSGTSQVWSMGHCSTSSLNSAPQYEQVRIRQTNFPGSLPIKIEPGREEPRYLNAAFRNCFRPQTMASAKSCVASLREAPARIMAPDTICTRCLCPPDESLQFPKALNENRRDAKTAGACSDERFDFKTAIIRQGFAKYHGLPLPLPDNVIVPLAIAALLLPSKIWSDSF